MTSIRKNGLSFLHLFFLFLRKDTRHLWASTHVILVPLFIFALVLFLFSFLSAGYMETQKTTQSFSLFIIFLFMGLSNGSKHLILEDENSGFLDEIIGRAKNITPYIVSKIVLYSLPWIISATVLWGFFDVMSIRNFLIFISLVVPLTSLLLTVEALSLRGTQTVGIGLIVISPLILPLFIISIWTLENAAKNQGIIALGLSGFILTLLSLFVIQKLIKQI